MFSHFNATSINHSISIFQFAKTSHRRTINFVNVLYCFRKIAKRVHLLLCVWNCEHLTSIKIPRSLAVFSKSSKILIFAISHKNYKLTPICENLIVILFSNVFANWYIVKILIWMLEMIVDKLYQYSIERLWDLFKQHQMTSEVTEELC